MNLNKRQQFLAILAIAALGLYLADKVVISPLTKNWKARSTRIAKLEEQVREGTETLKRENALREQWDEIRANTLSNSKPEAETQMLKAFERWSGAGGVSVSSIRPQWKESEEDYKSLECRADIAGSLSAIASFLYQVERDALGVKVDSLELTSRDQSGEALTLVLQVSGLVINPLKKPAQ